LLVSALDSSEQSVSYGPNSQPNSNAATVAGGTQGADTVERALPAAPHPRRRAPISADLKERFLRHVHTSPGTSIASAARIFGFVLGTHL
jgi:hypothetical protein